MGLDPVFTKREPRPDDFGHLTNKMFIDLITCAQEIFVDCGYPVYLVGSTLHSSQPRDLDICLIMPAEVFEKHYGRYPELNVGLILLNSFNDNAKYYFMLDEVLGNIIYLDFKVCPDNWFINKPKLLLSRG